MNRFLGGYAKRIDTPWKIYPVGVLFGLGFDTATEVALLVLAGSAVVGGLPFYAVLSLPILFAAGMCLFDTHRRLLHELRLRLGLRQADPQDLLQPDHHRSLGLHRALHRHHRDPRAHRPGDQPHRRVLGLHGRTSTSTGPGFIIVGVFVVTWLVALAIWHFGDIEGRWEFEGTQASTTTPQPATD